jgi:hypothetical protein
MLNFERRFLVGEARAARHFTNLLTKTSWLKVIVALLSLIRYKMSGVYGKGNDPINNN